ncbi:MAG TPA: DUF3307 domain-containing protein [bacterium]|nr:DUF3307 domain-containing protein [bacterium]
MFIFLRLILAHFIADFPLQTDEIYRLKIKGQSGQVLHALVIFCVSAACVAPFLGKPEAWAALLFIGVGHYIIDCAKLLLNDRITSRWIFFGFIADQVAHIATISFACFLIPSLHNAQYISHAPHWWAQVYGDNAAILYAIFFVIAIFASGYTVDTFRISFLPDLAQAEKSKTAAYYKLFERFVVFNATLISGLSLLFIPAVVLLRKPVAAISISDERGRAQFLSVSDIALNVVIGMACGISFLFLQ